MINKIIYGYKNIITLIIFMSGFGNLSSQDKIKITKLPSPVNSSLQEVCCAISDDGKKLFFTRAEHPQNSTSGKTDDMTLLYPPELKSIIIKTRCGMTLEQFRQDAKKHNVPKIYCSSNVNQDIWTAQISDKDNYKIYHPGMPINTANNNSVCCVLRNNKVLLFGEYEAGSSRTIGFSTSYFDKNNNFTTPKNMKIDDYYLSQLRGMQRNGGSKKNAFITGPILLISEALNVSVGKEDIYVSFYISKNKSWSKPLNLGNIINTSYNENRPFLTADTKTLFFGSDRSGKYNIYFSKRLDETWKNWTKPKALPYPVNTSTSNDDYFYKCAENNTVYFCSDRDGSFDIYKFELPDKYLNKRNLKISVFDKQNNTPLKADIKILTNLGDTVKFSNEEKAEYIVAGNKNIRLNINSAGYIPLDSVINLSVTDNNDLLFYLQEKENIILKEIIFNAGSAVMVSDTKNEIIKLFKMLKASPTMTIQIEGHTNNIGNTEKLRKLSRQRAKTIKSILVEYGISPDRISTIGIGPDKPLYNNDEPEKRKLNQRVEINILTE